MDVRTSAVVRQGPDGSDGPRSRRSYPAPGLLWPASNPLRVGAGILIAVVLGVVLLLTFRPWSSGGDSTPYNYNPYGQGSVVHGGQLR